MPEMTLQKLLDEGRRLARPCHYLRPEGTAFAAIWGGDGVVGRPDAPVDHWISVDCRFLPQKPRRGVLSLYTSIEEEDFGTHFLAFDESAELPTNTNGTLLFAHDGCPLPPVDALFHFASPEVRTWLVEDVGAPDVSRHSKFAEILNAYWQQYHKEYPFYPITSHAILGGWHHPWPDNDWEDLREHTLCVWTFQDSEPWQEIWDVNGSFRAIERTT